MTIPIELVAADIDGCFSLGGRLPIDLHLCGRARAWNERSAVDALTPPLVFCTARPLSYVQCLHQATGARLPSIAECGAVMWDPRDYLWKVHPDYTEEHRRHFREAYDQAWAELHSPDEGLCVEPDKFCQLTVYPVRPMTMEGLLERIAPFAARWDGRLVLDATHSVINFLPPGINKGSGLLWLARETGIDPSRIVGIGDAVSDWDFMAECGTSAAPSNARPELLERCDWRLEGGPVDCIDEVYARIAAINRPPAGTTPLRSPR